MEEFVPFLRRSDDPQTMSAQKPQVETYTQAGMRRLAQPRYAARIAVYDDMIAPPRVIIIEPCDITTYLTQIIQTVYQLMCEQGGDLPHSMIRELVENFIHAEFIEPTISILDRGQTLVFSDQGPGIANKAAAMKPSFSTATDEMKRYIRGVGSGLPMVESYLKMRQGTMTIEDNLDHGTIVTVSFAHQDGQRQDRPTTQQAQTPAPGTYPMPYVSQMASQPPYPYVQQGYAYGPAGYAPGGYGQPPSYAPQVWPPYPTLTPYPYVQTSRNPAQQTGEISPIPHERDLHDDQPTEPMPAVQPASDYPVSPPEVDARMREVLGVFGEGGLVGGKQLQAKLGVSPATASRRFKELETAGLVSKVGQKYALTTRGRDVLSLMNDDSGSR